MTLFKSSWCKLRASRLKLKYSTVASHHQLDKNPFHDSVPEENPKVMDGIRYNQFGVQMLSPELFKALFSQQVGKKDLGKINRCLEELQKHNLGNKQKAVEPVSIKIPPLKGSTIEEHFFNLGQEQSGPYKEAVLELLKGGVPEMPKTWSSEPGWSVYRGGSSERIDFPKDDALVLDVEITRSAGPGPTLAVAVSQHAWYSWVGPQLTKSTSPPHLLTTQHLIPLESASSSRGHRLTSDQSKPRIVVGHNVSFDRSRVKEQYWLNRTSLRFLDTMSLHVAVSGVTSYQKALLKAGLGDDDWTKVTSLSSLSKVHELYCGTDISKEERNIFIEGSIADVKANFQQLMTYCANDVLATLNVLEKLFPLFLNRFPHPVTLAGILELQTAYLPVNSNWLRYLHESDRAYEDLDLEAKHLLSQSANDACTLLHDGGFKSDLWLWDQDWEVKHLNLKKVKVPKRKVKGEPDVPVTESEEQEDEGITSAILNKLEQQYSTLIEKQKLLPVRPTLLPGYPNWYRKLCTKPSEADWVPGPDNLSTSMQVTPKLLRLTWNKLPIHFVRGYGWGVVVPLQTDINIEEEGFPGEQLIELCLNTPGLVCDCKDKQCNRKVQKDPTLQYNRFCRRQLDYKIYGLIKLPHKDGADQNVGNPLARDFLNKFSDSGLSGSKSYAERMIQISKTLSYWRNNRDRIGGQVVCWLNNVDYEVHGMLGAIIPQVVVCGTLTRRAVEPTWMTASNVSEERIGSELRGMVQAPPGYSIVGADVDSQELWIAALLGDAFEIGEHGATPFGWMTLNGQKADGSDMHSVTARAVGISRGDAKVLNYARIYGAGQKFSERLLRQFNPKLSTSEASHKASSIFNLTKGKRMFRLQEGVLPQFCERDYSRQGAIELCRSFGKTIDELFEGARWVGGTESSMFNCLEKIANQEHPKTPFLNSQLSRALEPSLDPDGRHLPTRINWVVQSGAVDFLHLMLVSMTWLLGPKTRFCLSFHDEVRYLVPDNYKYRTALALHITQLLTRAFCVSRLGMVDLPHSVAFFSSVDVDTVLRKEASDENKTPSNPYGLSRGYGVALGESIDVYNTIKKAKVEAQSNPPHPILDISLNA